MVYLLSQTILHFFTCILPKIKYLSMYDFKYFIFYLSWFLDSFSLIFGKILESVIFQIYFDRLCASGSEIGKMSRWGMFKLFKLCLNFQCETYIDVAIISQK